MILKLLFLTLRVILVIGQSLLQIFDLKVQLVVNPLDLRIIGMLSFLNGHIHALQLSFVLEKVLFELQALRLDLSSGIQTLLQVVIQLLNDFASLL